MRKKQRTVDDNKIRSQHPHWVGDKCLLTIAPGDLTSFFWSPWATADTYTCIDTHTQPHAHKQLYKISLKTLNKSKIGFTRWL